MTTQLSIRRFDVFDAANNYANLIKPHALRETGTPGFNIIIKTLQGFCQALTDAGVLTLIPVAEELKEQEKAHKEVLEQTKEQVIQEEGIMPDNVQESIDAGEEVFVAEPEQEQEQSSNPFEEELPMDNDNDSYSQATNTPQPVVTHGSQVSDTPLAAEPTPQVVKPQPPTPPPNKPISFMERVKMFKQQGGN